MMVVARWIDHSSAGALWRECMARWQYGSRVVYTCSLDGHWHEDYAS